MRSPGMQRPHPSLPTHEEEAGGLGVVMGTIPAREGTSGRYPAPYSAESRNPGVDCQCQLVLWEDSGEGVLVSSALATIAIQIGTSAVFLL